MKHIHKKKLLFFYLCAQSLFVFAGPVSWFQSCGQSIKNIFARLQHKNIVTKKNIGIAAGCALGVYWVYKQCIAKKPHILYPARDYLFLRNDNTSGIKIVPCLQQEKLAVTACRDLKIDGESAASVIGKIDGATCGYHALKNACIALDEYYKGGRSQSWLSTVQSRVQESRLYAQFMQGALPYIKENRKELNKSRPSMNLRLNDQGNWLEEGEIAGSPRSLLSNLGHENTVSDEATLQNAQVGWNEKFSSLFSHIPGHIQDHVTVISQLEPFNVHKSISDSSSIDGRVGHILQSLQAACNAAEDSNLDKAKYMHCFIVNTSCQNSSMNAHSGVHYVLYVVYVDGGVIQSYTMNSIEGIACDNALTVLKNNYVNNVKENVAKFSAQDYMHRWQQAYSRFENAVNTQNISSIVDVLESGDLSLFKEVDQSKVELHLMIQKLYALLIDCISCYHDFLNIETVQRLQEDINNFINGEQLVVRRSDQNEETKE